MSIHKIIFIKVKRQLSLMGKTFVTDDRKKFMQESSYKSGVLKKMNKPAELAKHINKLFKVKK